MFWKHLVWNLREVKQLGDKLSAFWDSQDASQLHDVAFFSVGLFIPIFFELAFENFAPIFQKKNAFISIFEHFFDTFSNLNDNWNGHTLGG